MVGNVNMVSWYQREAINTEAREDRQVTHSSGSFMPRGEGIITRICIHLPVSSLFF